MDLPGTLTGTPGSAVPGWVGTRVVGNGGEVPGVVGGGGHGAYHGGCPWYWSGCWSGPNLVRTRWKYPEIYY